MKVIIIHPMDNSYPNRRIAIYRSVTYSDFTANIVNYYTFTYKRWNKLNECKGLYDTYIASLGVE